jgi:hypothetical protein
MTPQLNLEKFIPKGLYCYKTLEVIEDKEYGFRMKVKNCIFYQHQNKKNSCWLMNGEEIDDQCKICGLNEFLNK